MVPVTHWGKFLSVFLIFASVGVLGFIIGKIAEMINDYGEKKKRGLKGTAKGFKRNRLKLVQCFFPI